MKTITTIVTSMLIITNIMSQKMEIIDGLPFHEIPEYDVAYSANTIAARMIDGLGFRYRWATDGLRTEDLSFKPSEDGRTCEETINHLLGLSSMIVKSTSSQSSTSSEDKSPMNFEEKRAKTLDNLLIARDNMLKVNSLEELKDENKSKKGSNEYPFYNQINGPIADALWHTGQVVSFRRSSGNPMTAKINYMSGKKRG